MRASVLYPGGRMTLETRPVPRPDPGDVLIEVAAVGVCGSDTHYLRHGRIGAFVVEAPLVLGHEASGRIVAVGPGVPAARIGERVSIEPQRPDPHSAESLRGEYNLCPAMRFYATPPVDGALAEYVTIGSAFAHAIPDTVSDEAAALFEPLSVGIAALRKAAVGLGGSVLVAGAGPIGLLCAQVARASGLTRIVVTDPDPARRRAAERFGATIAAVPGEATVGTGFDAFIDASGAPPAIRAGIPAVRPGGRIVLVGMGADDLALPVSLIQSRELVLTGVFRYANTWPAAIALAAAGRVDLDGMVTGRFALEDAEAALNADRDPGGIKAVVRPGAAPHTEEES
ncbi:MULTISPECIES: NAD(P)-dependent alcohol dehydrogenase [Tsukamurella]|uniref:NAD(P)-dependent alcohol dehydrogenase n=2 Tax=Tsukamurella TaxID=2060 RepID=A0A5C5RZH3_9ACTN|nr:MULTISPECIES: NAD(P)-dependent alcohol dehydrogenase [Tsukamurella]NMD57309.1 NAD(P)-dependent alcohol dehydrogenase [Tsukamurella columbiensis]TWS27848.1 NAD(P)-dependent alcohol dehydrogenase [Tsukamurella conjunctivitidis]